VVLFSAEDNCIRGPIIRMKKVLFACFLVNSFIFVLGLRKGERVGGGTQEMTNSEASSKVFLKSR